MCSVEGQILILDIHKYSTYVIEVFGLFFNFLVIYFLNTDQKGAVKSYKTTVIIHCIMDIGLGVLHILGMFQIESVGTTIYMTLAGPIQFINNYLFHNWSFVLANFFFSCSIFCGSVTVLYRYLVVVKKQNLEMLHILIMSIPMLVMAGVIASQYIPYYAPLPEKEYKEYKKLLNSKIWARDKFYGEDFIALTSPDSQQSGHFYNYFSIVSYFGTAVSIIVFSILIARHLKKNRSNMSEGTLKLEKQIQMILIIQALFPIFLGYIPNIIPILMAMFDIPLQCYIIFVGVCITYIPLINPCILLLMTPQYRKRILRYIWRKEDKRIGQKTTTIIGK